MDLRKILILIIVSHVLALLWQSYFGVMLLLEVLPIDSDDELVRVASEVAVLSSSVFYIIPAVYLGGFGRRSKFVYSLFVVVSGFYGLLSLTIIEVIRPNRPTS